MSKKIEKCYIGRLWQSQVDGKPNCPAIKGIINGHVASVDPRECEESSGCLRGLDKRARKQNFLDRIFKIA